MNIKKGMVVQIDFNPTKGSETGKVRPGIVVTNNTYNERIPVIQVVPVTSWNEKKSKIITNVELDPSEENGLKKKSIADCLQTRPLNRRYRLKKVIGKVSDEELKNIDNALKIVFDL